MNMGGKLHGLPPISFPQICFAWNALLRTVMAAPDAAIHPARPRAEENYLRSQALARWMAGSSPAMTQ
jgi:hypothetical protein